MDKGIESLADALGATVTEQEQSINVKYVAPDEYTNGQMEQMLVSLQPLLDRRDIVGYAAARNTRVLRSECMEYLKRRDELISKYGDPEIGEDGSPTGNSRIKIGSEGYKSFCSEIELYANIKHRPNLFKISYGEVIGKMSGNEILDCEWMLIDGDA